MTVQQIVIFALLAVGLLLLVRFPAMELLRKAKNAVPQPREKRMSLKQRKELLSGRLKVSMRKKLLADADSVLTFEGRREDIRRVKRNSIVLACAGALAAALLKNWFLLPVLAAVGYFAPLWIVKARSGSYQAQTAIELETALSIITSSYLRCENIILAVEENIDYLNEPVLTPFRIFLTQARMISADTTAALQDLQRCFPNEVFQNWCGILIQCQENRMMKAVLQPTIASFADIREVQAEYDTAMEAQRRDNLTLCLGAVVAPILFRIFSPEWFGVLFTTLAGKLIITLIALVALFDINMIIDLTEPLSYSMIKRGKK